MKTITANMLRRAAVTSFVVGPVLTLVNQFGAITGDAPIAWTQAALTFLVPFAVSLATSVMISREHSSGPNGTSRSEHTENADDPEPAVDADPEPERDTDYTDSPANEQIRDALQAISQIKGNAERVNAASIERKQMVDELMETSRFLRTSLENVHTRANDSYEDLRHAGEGIERMASAASGVSDRAQSGVALQTSVFEAVSEFQGDFKAIETLAESIAGISASTRLLALNATIEAARAGDAGRGFAVVAAEVKSLAASTEASVQSITELLGTMTASISHTQSSVNDLAQTIEATAEGSQESISLTQEISDQVVGSVGTVRDIAEEMEQHVSSFEHILEQLDVMHKDVAAAIQGSANNVKLAGEAMATLEASEKPKAA